MSVRLASTLFVKHGRSFLQKFWRRDIGTNILEQNKQLKRTSRYRLPVSSVIVKPRPSPVPNVPSTVPRLQSPSFGILRVGQHARKLFIDNVLTRCTTTYSEELRNKATKKLFYGDSAPFFALIGVSLASGSGLLTKDDELEGVCWEVRESANRLQQQWTHNGTDSVLNGELNIDAFDIGPSIGKGCNAVVYATTLKDKNSSAATTAASANPAHEANFIAIPDPSAPGVSESAHNADATSPIEGSLHRYPLALKMMFNYDIQSNALSILNAMYKETVPARQRPAHSTDAESDAWEQYVREQTHSLPAHPNIVCMYGFFCDEVRNFPQGQFLYPSAQPARINPQGYGRNMSLYVLMKRYDCSLRHLIDAERLNGRTRLLLFTQLLEAVAHMNRHGIAHRDIKSDNILIEVNDDGEPPLLVLSDFGCCLADKAHGLQMPYSACDVSKGGNPALMAPEILNKQPGPFAVLNYDKADLWACGAIAYEIFGHANPFYQTNRNESRDAARFLRSSKYEVGDLPPLDEATVPFVVRQLITNILNPRPAKRVSANIAANVMQLFLWAPSDWLKSGSMPRSSEILQWLLSLTSKIMCEAQAPLNNVAATLRAPLQMSFSQFGRRTYVEYLLICSFLARVHLQDVRNALQWMHTTTAAA